MFQFPRPGDTGFTAWLHSRRCSDHDAVEFLAVIFHDGTSTLLIDDGKVTNIFSDCQSIHVKISHDIAVDLKHSAFSTA